MRTLVITGATGGLGTEVVRHLLGSWNCVVLHRSEESFAELRKAVGESDRLSGLQADLSDAASVHRAMQQVERPYGLVHLAGGYASGSLLDTTDETWTQMIGLNLTGAFVAMREVLRIMDREDPGRIVVISSDAARTKAPGNLAYTVSKSGLNALVEVVAAELRGSKITINALLPTSLDTPAMRKFAAREDLVPLDRVAAAIQFLLSEEGASVHGALVPLSAR